jgi:hypothetical protein
MDYMTAMRHYEGMLSRMPRMDCAHIDRRLADLHDHHQGTWIHSVETGRMAGLLAVAFGQDRVAAEKSGLSHDIGKTCYDASLLGAGSISTRFFEGLKNHPLVTYELLRSDGEYTAAHAGARHHMFQGDRSYPDIAPGYSKSVSEKEKCMIGEISLLAALGDFTSALKRNNDHFLGKAFTTPVQMLEIMLREMSSATQYILASWPILQNGYFDKNPAMH